MPSESLSREQRRNARKVLGSEAAAFFERVEIDNRQLDGRIKRLGNQLHAEAEERKRAGAARDEELERLRREVMILQDQVIVPLGKRILDVEEVQGRQFKTVAAWKADDARHIMELALAYGSTTWRERLRWLFTGRPPRRSLEPGSRDGAPIIYEPVQPCSE